jgi:hypothetical protein
VCEVQQPGWVNTVPGTADPDAPCQTSPVLDSNRLFNLAFANYAPPVDLEVVKYEDRNANGQQDAEDRLQSGWTFWLDENRDGVQDAGEPTATTQVNDTGAGSPISAFFTGLAPGQAYQVCEVQKDGWFNSEPGTTGTDAPCRTSQVLQPEVTPEAVWFGNYRNARLQAIKLGDSDRDGQPPFDGPLPGWTFWLDENRDGVQDNGEPTATTDDTGAVRFPVTPGQSYQVCEVQQPGWVNTVPGTADPDAPCQTSPVLDSNRLFNLAFANYRSANTVTLEKEWVDARAGDATSLIITGGVTDPAEATSTATGASGSETDTTNVASTDVYSGETVTLKEALSSVNDGTYTSELSCDAGVVPDDTGAFTMPEGPVTCTFTNKIVQDLTVSTTATGSFSREYSWQISKHVDGRKSVRVTLDDAEVVDDRTFGYEVTVRQTGVKDSGWAAAGTVTVANPNADTELAADVTVTTSIGGTCTVVGGEDANVPAGGSVTLN